MVREGFSPKIDLCDIDRRYQQKKEFFKSFNKGEVDQLEALMSISNLPKIEK